jgi:hypothetical protein
MPTFGHAFRRGWCHGSNESTDLDELVQRWEAAYTLKEQERLKERYAIHLRELEFYRTWRKENPLARWEPRLFVDG